MTARTYPSVAVLDWLRRVSEINEGGATLAGFVFEIDGRRFEWMHPTNLAEFVNWLTGALADFEPNSVMRIISGLIYDKAGKDHSASRLLAQHMRRRLESLREAEVVAA